MKEAQRQTGDAPTQLWILERHPKQIWRWL